MRGPGAETKPSRSAASSGGRGGSRFGRSRKARLLYVGLVDVWSGFVVLTLLLMVAMRLGGASLNVVQTASMTPSLPVDTLTMTRPVDTDAIEVDDVIVFTNRNDEQVMHRVTEILDHAGVRRFRTKGDANRTTDSQLVHEKHVTGGLVGSIRNVGAFARSMQSPIGFLYLALFLSPLLAWAARGHPQSRVLGPESSLGRLDVKPDGERPLVIDAGGGVLCPSWLDTALCH